MTTTLRLTRQQAELLIPTFRLIYTSHLNYQHTGHLRDCHPELPFSGLNRRFGHYNPVFMDLLLGLWKPIRAMQSSSGGRLYGLDAFGLATCVFAVRVTMQRIRHGHHEAWAPRLDRSAAHLIAKLEREHKRLKRALIAHVGNQQYARAARGWRSFLKFLRYAHLYCRCSYRRRNNLYRFRRLMLDQFCEWTREELQGRGQVVPDDLRTRVRRLVAYVRRGRTLYTVGYLHNDKTFAASRFANYVMYGDV